MMIIDGKIPHWCDCCTYADLAGCDVKQKIEGECGIPRPDFCPLRELVRCKNCKHLNPNGIDICKLHDIRPTHLMMDNWFCADGEKVKE